MNAAARPPASPATFTPIGYVESEFAGYAPSDEIRARPSRIILRPELAPGLMGLTAGQSILVLFHLHRAADYQLQLHPGHNPQNPVRGVFATRSQYRPIPSPPPSPKSKPSPTTSSPSADSTRKTAPRCWT